MKFEDFISNYQRQITQREYELMEQAWLDGWYTGHEEGYEEGYDSVYQSFRSYHLDW